MSQIRHRGGTVVANSLQFAVLLFSFGSVENRGWLGSSIAFVTGDTALFGKLIRPLDRKCRHLVSRLSVHFNSIPRPWNHIFSNRFGTDTAHKQVRRA
jgi:hypothetical protein